MAVRVLVKTLTGGEEEIIPLDHYSVHGDISLQVSVEGSVTYTLYSTLDDVQRQEDDTYHPPVVWFVHPDLTAKSASLQANYAYKPRFLKFKVEGSGKARLTAIQPE